MKRIAALVPAHNEEGVIGMTLASLAMQIPSDDIYVVDDGSRDRSTFVAQGYTANVLKLEQNVGKAEALNSALRHFKLSEQYQFILFMDADTRVDPSFTEECLKHFVKDENEELACVVGRVQSLGGSWIGKYRLWEYAIAHSIHKRAQAHMNSMLVVPGCATMYRSDIFENIEIPAGTFTEDMDFTFLLHRSKHTHMIFEDDAVVYTQDPQTLKTFIKQVNRWYMGFWQAIKKHNLPWHGQSLDFEAALLASEGLFSGLITLVIIAFIPVLYSTHSLGILKIPVLFDLGIFFIPSLMWSSFKTKEFSLILYIPAFYVLRLITSMLFLFSFFRAFLSSKSNFTWDTQRFTLTT
jgi:cellulose synthase/poly-beta-1,6-N-acetylglucosamine synthase-like glycosyltransferase